MNRARTPGYGLACVLILPMSLAWAGGGTVVKLDGTASIEHQGKSTPAAAGAALQSGDTLKVAERGKVQLRFEDDSVFAVPGPATFKVDEFRMPAAGKGGKAIYTLQGGGLRSITGSVSKHKGDQYELRTEQGTITVNGSAYSALLCKGGCGGQNKPGLYVRGEAGVIIVTNAAGQMKLHAGQIAFMETKASAPVTVTVSPFNDQKFAADYGVDVEFDTEVNPPRVEPEPPGSPS